MAKKAAGKSSGGASVLTSHLYRIKSKPSSLVDTRVVYCGDNLEHPAIGTNALPVALELCGEMDSWPRQQLAE